MMRTDGGFAGATFDLDDWGVPVRKLGELIINIANSHELYERMLACVPGAAAKFDSVKMVQSYEDVYRRCYTEEGNGTRSYSTTFDR
jgi:hypothetical protein